MTGVSIDRERRKVAFVMEQHVGHRVYAENLRAAFESVEHLHSTWLPVSYTRRSRIGGLLPAGIAATWAGRQEVRHGLRHLERDVTVFNTQVPAALGGRLARRAPYVLITDVTPSQYDAMAADYGHTPDRIAPIAAWKRHHNRETFRRAAACVGWSSWAAQSMITDYGVPDDRVVVIPPGVDTERWRPREGPRRGGPVRLLFVGGEFDRKGGPELLAASAALTDAVELILVTKSSVAPAAGVTVVSDLGPNDPRLIDLYRNADIFVLPSRAETFGIAAVEACSAGLPVVASTVGGFGDIVADGENGLLVPPGDVSSLARALTELCTDPVRRGRMGEAARSRAVERFDAARNASRLAELIQGVMR